MGQGWGEDCMRCPQHGEDEHRLLCAVIPPGGKITIASNVTGLPKEDYAINECTLRPDICGKGHTCIDTLTGYECVCKPGFRLSSSKICEGNCLICAY